MDFLKDVLRELREADLLRELKTRGLTRGRYVHLEDEKLLDFSSNNYLGFAAHPAIQHATAQALSEGVGATASRLVTGGFDAHLQLERELAEFHRMPASRLFGSGYQANLGLLGSIVQSGDQVLSDALNHASIIDGCRLGRGTIEVVPHLDLESFAQRLRKPVSGRRFVVTDSVFSMDGDMAPLRELRALCDKAGAYLVVDESHALGCFGSQGRGLCSELGVIPDALSSGMGKSFGSAGGYVVGSEALAQFLANRARSFVFSTATPPALVEGSQEALRLLSGDTGDHARNRLHQRIGQLRDGLERMGRLQEGSGYSPIFPIPMDSPAHALEGMKVLRKEGLLCQAMRPPTVPKGGSRLRVTVSALHELEDIDLLLSHLSRL